MKIKGDPKEIADFVLQLQSQQNEKLFNLDKKADDILSIRQEASKFFASMVDEAKKYNSDNK